MTLEQHEQAVAALATMIGDWIRARPAAAPARATHSGGIRSDAGGPPFRHE